MNGTGKEALQFKMPLVDTQDFCKPCAVGVGDADRDPALKGLSCFDRLRARLEDGLFMLRFTGNSWQK